MLCEGSLSLELHLEFARDQISKKKNFPLSHDGPLRKEPWGAAPTMEDREAFSERLFGRFMFWSHVFLVTLMYAYN
jgi:hypothetical protein